MLVSVVLLFNLTMPSSHSIECLAKRPKLTVNIQKSIGNPTPPPTLIVKIVIIGDTIVMNLSISSSNIQLSRVLLYWVAFCVASTIVVVVFWYSPSLCNWIVIEFHYRCPDCCLFTITLFEMVLLHRKRLNYQCDHKDNKNRGNADFFPQKCLTTFFKLEECNRKQQNDEYNRSWRILSRNYGSMSTFWWLRVCRVVHLIDA